MTRTARLKCQVKGCGVNARLGWRTCTRHRPPFDHEPWKVRALPPLPPLSIEDFALARTP